MHGCSRVAREWHRLVSWMYLSDLSSKNNASNTTLSLVVLVDYIH
jgi:hypothetical protein